MARYYVEVSNAYLGKHRRVAGNTRREAQWKAQLQLDQWADQEGRARHRAEIADAKAHAAELTIDAERQLKDHRSLLLDSLTVDHRVDWQKAAEVEPFEESPPSLFTVSREHGVPARSWLLEFLRIRSRAKRIEAEGAAQASFEQAMLKWESERSAHEQAALEHQNEIENLQRGYERREAESIASYVALAVAGSAYPYSFPADREVFCGKDDPSRVVIEVEVPRIEDVPHATSYRLDATRNEIVEHPISKAALQELYDGIVYQTVLRTLHEAFDSDYVEAVESVVVNVYAERINAATGADERVCLATCEAGRRQFSEFDLARVDPMECFRALKGLVAKRPSALAHIDPLRAIEVRADSEGLAVEIAIDQAPTPDLLQMDPFEFEQVVGSLFQRVFEREGANVEVTKASHDGGVDVTVDDPDEIKGGRIVIQVKRYRGVVAPGYVRDLYGTMLNEGASKGILVATGHYGPEAREFAQDKPITLIDADGLLRMLAEHGYRYRIEPVKDTPA